MAAGASGSGLTSQQGEEEESSFALEDVVAGLLEQDEEVQKIALHRLAGMVDEAEGAHAETLGECMRNFGALEPLLSMVRRSSTCASALRIIGNLASDVVDRRSGVLLHPFDPRHNSHYHQH